MAVQLRRKSSKKRRARGAAQESISESRRREIVAEAVRLMEEKGFSAVSVQHVANALAFSKANFYHHIKSKEKLLHEVFVDTLQLAIANIGAIVSSDRAAPEKLNALVEFYVSLMLERRAVMLVWFKERAHLTGTHLAEVTRLEQQVTGLLKQLYSAGIEEGHFKRIDVDLMRLAIFGMCFHLTKLPPTTHLSRETITRQLQELATGALLIASAGDT
jgi:AcrR family transcriptional regulator